MRPIRCLSKTLLPPPLRPMMAVTWPLGMVRLTPLSTCCRSKLLYKLTSWIIPLKQDGGHKVVPDQHQDRREHDGFGGGLSYAFSPIPGIKSLIGADPGDNKAEAHRFQKTASNVAHLHHVAHLGKVGTGADTEHLHPNEVAAKDPDDVEDSRE